MLSTHGKWEKAGANQYWHRDKVHGHEVFIVCTHSKTNRTAKINFGVNGYVNSGMSDKKIEPRHAVAIMKHIKHHVGQFLSANSEHIKKLHISPHDSDPKTEEKKKELYKRMIPKDRKIKYALHSPNDMFVEHRNFKNFKYLKEALKNKFKAQIDDLAKTHTRDVSFTDHIFNGDHGIHPSGHPDRVTIPYEGTHPETGKQLAITFSRHPHDVVGMSTGKKWDSCLNMRTGQNKKFLPAEYSHGTHVAYLHDADDSECKNPHMRLAFKPYHKYADGKDKSRDPKKEKPVHTILVGEPSSYSSPNEHYEHSFKKHFEETAKNWVHKQTPPQKTGFYKRNPYIYSDAFGSGTHFHKNMIDSLLTSNDRGNQKERNITLATSHPEFSAEHIDRHWNVFQHKPFVVAHHGSTRTVSELIKKGPKQGLRHIEDGLTEREISMEEDGRDKIPSEKRKFQGLLSDYIDRTSKENIPVRNRFLNLDNTHVHQLSNHPHPISRNHILDKIKGEHLPDYISKETDHENLGELIDRNPHITPEHVNTIEKKLDPNNVSYRTVSLSIKRKRKQFQQNGIK